VIVVSLACVCDVQAPHNPSWNQELAGRLYRLRGMVQAERLSAGVVLCDLDESVTRFKSPRRDFVALISRGVSLD
jgi:hypothetical protein